MDTINNLTIEEQRQLYNVYFASGSYTDCKFETKIKLLHLLCFITYQCKQKMPDTIKNTLDVLEKIVEKRKLNPKESWDQLLIGISITCDDLLYGVMNFENTTGFDSLNTAVTEIRRIINMLMPF